MALQRPARLLRFDKMIDNKGLTRIRVWSNCRKMRVFRDHESETGKVPLKRQNPPIAARVESQGEEWAGEQRAGARRSRADRYQWLSAEERVRTGTLEAASTWHS